MLSLSAVLILAHADNQTCVERAPAQHAAYELLRDETVDEYQLRCASYRHAKSGAEVISVQADDDNKVFGIAFRTPVSDSTGVPHILEHSVLCGSEKYTSKEPFAELLKGSLQTFLNAFTYPDRTCYPVASQNTRDFYNVRQPATALRPNLSSPPRSWSTSTLTRFSIRARSTMHR